MSPHDESQRETDRYEQPAHGSDNHDVVDDLDAGPHCIHDAEPTECDVLCARCGHPCSAHVGGLECTEEFCRCDEFAARRS